MQEERCVTCWNPPHLLFLPLLTNLFSSTWTAVGMGGSGSIWGGEDYEDRNRGRVVNRVLKHPLLTSGLLISFKLPHLLEAPTLWFEVCPCVCAELVKCSEGGRKKCMLGEETLCTRHPLCT